MSGFGKLGHICSPSQLFFKHLNVYTTPTYATPTFIKKCSILVLIYNYSKQMLSETNSLCIAGLITFIRLVPTMLINNTAMPTNETDYSSHIKAVELV